MNRIAAAGRLRAAIRAGMASVMREIKRTRALMRFDLQRKPRKGVGFWRGLVGGHFAPAGKPSVSFPNGPLKMRPRQLAVGSEMHGVRRVEHPAETWSFGLQP
jgi:hypothetical protein